MDEKGVKVRTEMLENIEETYRKNVAMLYGAKDEDEIPMDDPLFANMRPVGLDGQQFDDGSGPKE